MDAVPAPAGSPGAGVSYVNAIRSALRPPERTALRWRDRRISCGELDCWIGRLSAGLRELGVRPGRTVAILTEPNHPAMLAVRYATHLLGGAVVYLRSINPRTDELLPLPVQAQMLSETRPHVLVVDAANADRARSLRRAAAGWPPDAGAPDLGELHLAGFEVSADDIADLLARPEPDQPPAGTVPGPASTDLAVVAHTSGSTGRPKAIRQSYRVWQAMVEAFPGSTAPGSGGTFLAVTPVSSTVGSMIDSILGAGGDAILHEGFHLPAVVRALRDEGVTDTYLAVPHLYRLLDHAAAEGLHHPSLRRLIYSGSPAAPRRIAAAAKVFGEAVSQLYGSTEAGGIAALTPADHCEPELLPTVGRPLPWVQVRILDPATGDEVPSGEVGEIWVRSKTTMDGYLTSQGSGGAEVPRDGARDGPGAGMAQGWLRTGDLGHWDRYGYLRLVDRVDNVVKSGGLKLYPAAVEAVLMEHPDVAEAVAYGVRDADHVEHLYAAVSLRPGGSCTPEELRERVSAALSPAYAPAVITVLPRLPLTDAGKPDRAALRAQASAAGTPGQHDPPPAQITASL